MTDSIDSTAPKIIGYLETPLSQWASIVTRTVIFPGNQDVASYHAIRQCDYVNVLAVTAGLRIPLVRQYRPTLERYTLELPGGLRDPGEDPLSTAIRELNEETGLQPIEPLIALGHLAPDAGRLENRLWGFVAHVNDEAAAGWQSEVGIETLFVTKTELYDLVVNGKMENALHVALLGMAVFRNVFDWKN